MPMMTLEHKASIREDALKRRRSISADAAAENSAKIAARLDRVRIFQCASAVLSYVSAKDNEVDTWPVLRSLLAAGRSVFVPVCEPGTKTLEWSLLEDVRELVPAKFGLFEPDPAKRRVVPVPHGSVCLVPGVAFTRCGRRLGLGGGYFDRFLARYDGFAIGLAHATQLVEEIPVERHDRMVDLLVTECGVTDCASLRAS